MVQWLRLLPSVDRRASDELFDELVKELERRRVKRNETAMISAPFAGCFESSKVSELAPDVERNALQAESFQLREVIVHRSGFADRNAKIVLAHGR